MQRLRLVLRKCRIPKCIPCVDFLYEIKTELLKDMLTPIGGLPFRYPALGGDNLFVCKGFGCLIHSFPFAHHTRLTSGDQLPPLRSRPTMALSELGRGDGRPEGADGGPSEWSSSASLTRGLSACSAQARRLLSLCHGGAGCQERWSILGKRHQAPQCNGIRNGSGLRGRLPRWGDGRGEALRNKGHSVRFRPLRPSPGPLNRALLR